MFVLGLTGGIATGKSTVSDMLSALGAEVVDADCVAHLLTQNDEPVLGRIKAVFGEEYFGPDGSLNRRKLGNLVFSDITKLRKLNEIVHPQIKRNIERIIKEHRDGPAPPKVLVLDAPLLIEMGLVSMVDTVWVVSADEQTQIERLWLRDGLGPEQAVLRIRCQLALEDKLEHANVVIDNSGSVQNTRLQVVHHFENLLAKLDG